MSGIYYYFWHQEPERKRIGNHALIDEDLTDIKNNLDMDFIVVDVEPSLFNNKKYLPGYNEAWEYVKLKCEGLGLKILPILSHGSGMLRDDWWVGREKNAFSPGRVPYKFGDGYWMDYNLECLEALKDHQRYILDNLPRQVSMGVCEVMEDVGYPHGHGTVPDTIKVTAFVKELINGVHTLGYKGIYHAFRDGRVFPHWFKEIGVNYQALSQVCDGQIDTVAPHHLVDPGREDYNLFEDGVKLLCDLNKNKLVYITLSADRSMFGLRKQWERVKAIDNDYTDIIFYSYNEGYNVSSELQTNNEHRAEIKEILAEQT